MSVWSPVIQVRHLDYRPMPVVIRVVLAMSLFATCYAAYSIWVTPSFTQPVARRQISSETLEMSSNLLENEELARRYLANYGWPLEPGYQFRTPQAYIYTQSWEHIDGGEKVLFKPFALIWRQQGGELGDEPLRIVSSSALVQFAQAFDIADPNPGRVISGFLGEDVEILGADGLRVNGRNFTFSDSSQSVWSDHPVHLVQGPHRGQASGMDIKLTTNLIDREGEDSAIAGIREIIFRKDVRLNLLTDLRKTPTGIPMKINCNGSLIYSVENKMATFDDDVRIYRGLRDGDQDIMRCERLSLHFKEQDHGAKEPSLGSGEPGEARAPIVTGIDSRLILEKIEASEIDGRKLELISQKHGLTAWMTNLRYHLLDRVITLDDPRNVEVRQKAFRLLAPEITIQHDERQNVIAARCLGGGKLWNRHESTRQVELAAQWKKQLNMFPDRISGLRVVELEGDAVVTQPHRKVGLTAETIRAWVKGDIETSKDAVILEKQAPSPTSDQVVTSSAGESPSLDKDNIEVERVLAVKNVVIISPRFQGETQRLEVMFDGEPNDEEIASGQSDPVSKNKSKSLFGDDSDTSSSILSQPLNLRAEQTQVHVRRGRGDEPDAMTQIFTSGNILVKQASNKEQGEDLEITGTILSVANRSPEQEILRVEGEPAQVRRGQMLIEGGNITIDRGQNQSVVEGAGRIFIPVRNGLDGKKLAQSSRLEVRWNERMAFDGLEANFFGLVQAHHEHNIMHCQEMRVTLNQRVSFTERQSGISDEGEVRLVHCLDGVDVESSYYNGAQLLSIRRAHFWEFTLNNETGETKAQGPGYITVWERGNENRAALSPSTIVLANRAKQADSSNWDYTRVNFYGESVGNVKRNNTKFKDRVEIIYGPVQHPLEVVDQDHLGSNAGWMRCQELQLSRVQLQDDEAYYELLGLGNAELEGQSFHGMADQINYDGSKGLYMLRSLGQHNATLWRQTQVGGERSRSDSKRIVFIPSKNDLRLDGTTRIDGVK